ncbi:MAG: four helix bundle protein [Fulvivirga sp.]|nr:four helix bundle protein [Fulvivirga sp.]
MKQVKKKRDNFRFENLQIWQLSIDISDHLLDLADEVENKRHYRFAEQLRGSVLSISNNIAEGSGSNSKKDFANFLNFSKRSVFETANILMILSKRGYIDKKQLDARLLDLDHISRKITNFCKALHA